MDPPLIPKTHREAASLLRRLLAAHGVARRVFVAESPDWGPGGAVANVGRVLRDDPRGWSAWGVRVQLSTSEADAVPEVAGVDCVHVRLAPRAEIRGVIRRKMGSAAARDPTLDRMNICFLVRRGLAQILVDEERWRGGTDVPGVPLGAYRAYVLHHEFGHALGLWAHATPARMLRARRVVPALAESEPDARGALPASIMMQQSRVIPEGFRFSCRVGVYDAFVLARVALAAERPEEVM